MPHCRSSRSRAIGIRNDRRPISRNGYTLIEVLFSIAFIALTLGILAQLLYSGAGIWEVNDRAYERQHQLKMVYETVYGDLASALTGPYLPEASVRGDETFMSFWRETEEGVIKVFYRYEPSEKKVYRGSGLWSGKAEEKCLFHRIEEWRFEYFDANVKYWRPSWDPDNKAAVPALIRVLVRSKEHDLGSFVIPMKTWNYEAEFHE